MSAQQTDFYNFVAASVPVVTTSETVIGTTRAISTAFSGQQLFVQFGVTFLTGTGTTAVAFNIRQGNGTSGAIVYGSASLQMAATNRGAFAFATVDSLSGDVAGQIYSLTVTQTAATGNGSATNVWSAVTVG